MDSECISTSLPFLEHLSAQHASVSPLERDASRFTSCTYVHIRVLLLAKKLQIVHTKQS